MASISDLKDVLKETLEERGVLNEIRAKVRAEIFNSLNEQKQEKKELSNENLILNEIIREYLLFNNYTNTLSVFLPESSQPQKPAFDRNYLTKKLKILEDKNSKELPLLYGLCFGLKRILACEEEDNIENKQYQSNVNFPKKEDIVQKNTANKIFNLDNPEPFAYKSDKNY